MLCIQQMFVLIDVLLNADRLGFIAKILFNLKNVLYNYTVMFF